MMPITQAELLFLLSLRPPEPQADRPSIDVAGLLELDAEHGELLRLAGLSGLVARGGCIMRDELVELDGPIAAIADALLHAIECVRIAATSADTIVVWQIFSGDESRLMVTPLGYGAFEALPMLTTESLASQIEEMLETASNGQQIDLVAIERHAPDLVETLVLQPDPDGWHSTSESPRLGDRTATLAAHLELILR